MSTNHCQIISNSLILGWTSIQTASDNNNELTIDFPYALSNKVFCIVGQVISENVKPSASNSSTRMYSPVIHYVTLTSFKAHYVTTNGSGSVHVLVNYLGY